MNIIDARFINGKLCVYANDYETLYLKLNRFFNTLLPELILDTCLMLIKYYVFSKKVLIM